MKAIKPFFLGILGGLVLAMALLLGLFLSPLREAVYFRLDPEMADIRSKLGLYQDWLAQTDLRIAENGNEPSEARAASDSLRNAQAKVWRDYKGWRNRLGELARAHARPTAEGFWPWAYSLRFWVLPIGAFLALLPGVLFAWLFRSPFRSGRVKPQGKARAQALSNFEEAIKKVARISETERGPIPMPIAEPNQPRASAFPPAASKKPVSRQEPPTTPLPTSVFIEGPDARAAAPKKKKKEPGTVHMPIVPDSEDTPDAAARDAGRETRFLQVGPGWGESLNPPGERIGSAGAAPQSGLSMEDEDAADGRSGNSADSPEETLGVMPATTEVERVERRKAEVLKLARKGMTSSEISRRMRISQDQVEFIIRLRREKG